MAKATTLADRLHEIVDANNLSEADVASTMQVSVDVVRKLLKGQTQTIKLDDGLRLCQGYGVDPWYLAFGRHGPPKLSATDDQRVAKIERELRETSSSVRRILRWIQEHEPK